MKPHGWKETSSKKYLLPIKQLSWLESFWNISVGRLYCVAFEFKIRCVCCGQKRQQKNQRQGSLGVAWNSFVHFHACLDEFPLLSAPVAFNYTLVHNSNWYASLTRWTMDFLQSIFLFIDQHFPMAKTWKICMSYHLLMLLLFSPRFTLK